VKRRSQTHGDGSGAGLAHIAGEQHYTPSYISTSALFSVILSRARFPRLIPPPPS
jgi:hypothetical protein